MSRLLPISSHKLEKIVLGSGFKEYAKEAVTYSTFIQTEDIPAYRSTVIEK